MAQDDNPSISRKVTKRQAWLQQAEDIRLPASTRIEAIENLARECQAAWHVAWSEGEPPPTQRQSAEKATKLRSVRYKEPQTIDGLCFLLLKMDHDRNVRRALVGLLPNWGEDGLRALLPALKMPDLRGEAIKVLDSAPATFQFGRDPGLAIMLILAGAGEADFLYLQREGGFTQGNLSGHLAKLEEAGYLEIEEKFKGKMPLTVCSLTGKGKAALSKYSRQMVGILEL